jgi:hypothetical protein
MADGGALGKFGGEFGQGTQTYAGAARAQYLWWSLRLGSFNPVDFCEPTLRTEPHMCPLVARSCLDQTGRACPLCPGKSDVDLFRYGESVVDFDAKITHGALNLRMPE